MYFGRVFVYDLSSKILLVSIYKRHSVLHPHHPHPRRHPHLHHAVPNPFYRVSRGEQLKDAGRPSHSCTGDYDDDDDC